MMRAATTAAGSSNLITPEVPENGSGRSSISPPPTTRRSALRDWLNRAIETADRVAVMYLGKLVEQGLSPIGMDRGPGPCAGMCHLEGRKAAMPHHPCVVVHVEVDQIRDESRGRGH